MSAPPSNETIENIKAFFAYVDIDKDGLITVDEIRNAMAVDFNADGAIDADERLKAGARWISDGPFATQDANGDQKISLSELLAYNA